MKLKSFLYFICFIAFVYCQNENAVFDEKDDEKSEVQSIDSKKLSKLITHTYEKTKSLIKETDSVFAILGNTGAGKSTTIGYLMGYDFKIVEQFFEDVLVCQNEDDNYPRTASSKEGSSSVTEFPKVYNIKSNNSNYKICDTPGFNDTKGTEAKIARSIAINCLYENVKISGIIVLLAQENFKNKARTCKDVFDIINQTCKNTESIKNNLIFVLNKFPEDKKVEDFKVSLKRLLSSGEPALYDSYIKKFVKLIADSKNCFFVHPADKGKSRKFLSRKFQDLSKELSPIPQNQLKFALDDNARTKLSFWVKNCVNSSMNSILLIRKLIQENKAEANKILKNHENDGLVDTQEKFKIKYESFLDYPDIEMFKKEIEKNLKTISDRRENLEKIKAYYFNKAKILKNDNRVAPYQYKYTTTSSEQVSKYKDVWREGWKTSSKVWVGIFTLGIGNAAANRKKYNGYWEKVHDGYETKYYTREHTEEILYDEDGKQKNKLQEWASNTQSFNTRPKNEIPAIKNIYMKFERFMEEIEAEYRIAKNIVTILDNISIISSQKDRFEIIDKLNKMINITKYPNLYGKFIKDVINEIENDKFKLEFSYNIFWPMKEIYLPKKN